MLYKKLSVVSFTFLLGTLNNAVANASGLLGDPSSYRYTHLFGARVDDSQAPASQELQTIAHHYEKELGVDRKTKEDPGAYMKSHQVLGLISPGQYVHITEKGIVPVNPGAHSKDDDNAVKQYLTTQCTTMRSFPKVELVDGKIPLNSLPSGNLVPHINFTGSWTKEDSQSQGPQQANILGGFGELELQMEVLQIPGVLATQENLAAYGAYLIKRGECFVMKDDQHDYLPIFNMTVGPTYVDSYLIKKEYGGGMYAEYHDRPHLHMPTASDAHGFLVLGRQNKKDEFQLTGFQIPYGYAIYTPPGVIHDDGFLIGRYDVVYSATPEFSTVIVKDRQHNLVKPKIV